MPKTDNAGRIADREPPPPGLVAAAEQDYHAMRGELAEIKKIIRKLLAGRHGEVEAVSDLWLTLFGQDPRSVAFLAATAIVQLVHVEDQHTPST